MNAAIHKTKVSSNAKMYKAAEISEDGLYRYSLNRGWGEHRRDLVFCMLNPSTADAEIDDPTIRRCMSFAEREGYTGIEVVNVFAFRATNPKQLRQAKDPVGPDNYGYLTTAARFNKNIVVAWGAFKHKQCLRTIEILHNYGARLLCLGKNIDGSPKHPLYIKADQPLIPF